MNRCRLWDSEKTESIPLEDAREADGTLFIATLAAALLAPEAAGITAELAQRILGAEFAIIEVADGTTTLVERISEPTPLPGDESRLSIEYLTVG